MLTSYDGQTITSDGLGNPLNYRDGIKLTWKNGRQLASSTVGNIVTTYNYDISGNRVYRAGGGFRHTYYVVDGVAMGEKIVFVSNGTTHYMEYMRDENGDVYGFIYDGSTYFLEKNALGDVQYLLDGSGKVLAQYTYDEWGKVVSVTDSNGNEITDKANVAHLNPFRYRSYYYDDETGLYYLGSRYYDPQTGRFVNADSVMGANKDVIAYNLFAYCSNNPINYSDSTGHAKRWERLGFSYDGSVADFKRLENGLPPMAFEKWIKNGGTRTLNRVEYNNNGVTKTLVEATYIPKDQVKDRYIEKSKALTDFDASEAGLLAAGIVTTFKTIPKVSVALTVAECVFALMTFSNQSDLWSYESCMNQGEGILEVTWEIDGARCGKSSYTGYYSWNGSGDPFEK